MQGIYISFRLLNYTINRFIVNCNFKNLVNMLDYQIVKISSKLHFRMNKIFTLLLLILFSFPSFAQLTSDGYYRVKNTNTDYYTYVMDNTGSISIANTTAEMGAILLYKGHEKTISDPSSVIYFSKHGTSWDFESQGTGLYKIINYYVSLKGQQPYYQLYASNGGMTVYLKDGGAVGPVDYHVLDIANSTKDRTWSIEPIDSKTDNYFGIKPSVEANGKFYVPFYAAFPFSFASQGMKAYTITNVENGVAIIEAINSSIIPAFTPIIIECSSKNETNNRLNLLTGTYPAVKGMLAGNMFYHPFRSEGKSADARVKFNDKTMRVLTSKDGKLVYSNDKTLTALYASGNYYCLKANQSYLPVPSGTDAVLQIMTEAEYKKYMEEMVIPGDVDGDKKVGTSDVMRLVNYILDSSASENFNKKAADLDGDGTIGSADLMKLVNKILEN